MADLPGFVNTSSQPRLKATDSTRTRLPSEPAEAGFHPAKWPDGDDQPPGVEGIRPPSRTPDLRGGAPNRRLKAPTAKTRGSGNRAVAFAT